MDYWYLGALAIALIAGIIYVSRRGRTGDAIQSSGTISEIPILFGNSGLRLLRSGKLLIQQNELVVTDDNNVEQLRMPIDQSLNIALRSYSPFDIPFWDVVDNGGRTLHLKFKPWSFSLLFSANQVADLSERLLQTINQIAGAEIVRVSPLAQPSLMRAVRFVPWVIIAFVVVIAIYAYSHGNLI